MNDGAKIQFSATTTPNASAIEIRSENERTAKSAIKLAQAWIKENGGRYTLVSFTSCASQWSNLIVKYTARIVYVGV